MSYGVVLFPSTSHAIKAEKALQAAGLSVRLIPTPRHLDTNCGLAACITWEERARVEEALRAARVEYDKVVPF